MQCLRPPYGVSYLAVKKKFVGPNGVARQLKAMVHEDNIFSVHMVSRTSDREIWKFFFNWAYITLEYIVVVIIIWLALSHNVHLKSVYLFIYFWKNVQKYWTSELAQRLECYHFVVDMYTMIHLFMFNICLKTSFSALIDEFYVEGLHVYYNLSFCNIRWILRQMIATKVPNPMTLLIDDLW